MKQVNDSFAVSFAKFVSNFIEFGDSQQGRVVQKVDNAIHRINHYPADSVICFVNTYPLDSDLSDG